MQQVSIIGTTTGRGGYEDGTRQRSGSYCQWSEHTLPMLFSRLLQRTFPGRPTQGPAVANQHSHNTHLLHMYGARVLGSCTGNYCWYTHSPTTPYQNRPLHPADALVSNLLNHPGSHWQLQGKRCTNGWPPTAACATQTFGHTHPLDKPARQKRLQNLCIENCSPDHARALGWRSAGERVGLAQQS